VFSAICISVASYLYVSVLRSSGVETRRRVVWYVGNNVLQESVVFILKIKAAGYFEAFVQ